jgi:ATP-dependent DNA helicase DinG
LGSCGIGYNLKSKKYISESACTFIRESISRNNGGEVFFIAKVDENQIVVGADAHAFGSQNAVPVLMKLVSFGDVVIHNHPDGNLEPSDSDINVAGALGDLGVASYIVDNSCENLHIIVRPFHDEDIHLLKKEELIRLLSPDGPVAKSLAHYEYRPEQIAMIEAVIRAFNEDSIAVIEAGTGTGKSLAYLIPSIIWSLQNKERVVISTNTINLQEQIMNKDLPLLREKAGLEFRSELMKGRHNYLCLRRTSYIGKESLWLESEKDRESLDYILEWAQNTKDGSLSDLNIRPGREVWERLRSEVDTCLRAKCDNYENCFFYMARRRASRADILIVNHHLLMADLALRKDSKNYTTAAVLPPFKRIVFDEAHNVETVATNYFTVRASKWMIIYQLGRLSSRSSARKDKGLLSLLIKRLGILHKKRPSRLLEGLIISLNSEIIPSVHQSASIVESEYSMLVDSFLGFAEERGEEVERNFKLRITPEIAENDFWQDSVIESCHRIIASLQRFKSLMKNLADDFSSLPDDLKDSIREALVEVLAVASRLEQAASNLSFILEQEEGFCKWIEYIPQKYTRSASIALCIAPLDIRENMRCAVYDVNKTVIMTSATLTVQKRFDYILDLLGIQYYYGETPESDRTHNLPPAEERLLTLQLGTPFDYEKQAFVGVTTDTPEPSSPDFSSCLQNLIMKAISISKGGGFVLFTSYGLMDRIYDSLSPFIRDLGFNCMCQGEEPRHKLLQKFIHDRKSILFATASFWEGVDVKGDSLKCLIITKLPFRVPTEPLLQARSEALKNEGRDSYRDSED